ncbi:MAG: bifunctional methylenetetrahydrofolate dehydrogenase/methenyltetrahydrofolate cyclohydrolase FolD [Cryomorphaceae bacterium]|nr:MAG: bifunctional methylenetetrahydrofolate dehydrogenase/methenyltetrahydrofolate cyclohydrolase FolD [Cryomorphaceae bacterium]
MTLLDGKKTSQDIKDELAALVAERKQQGKKVPHLAAILVGNDGASQTYVNAKVKACEKIGFGSSLRRLPATIPEDELLTEIDALNSNPDVDGFIVQLPLPGHIDEQKVINAVHPNKDVDGFHPVNMGKLVLGLPAFIPATPNGIVELIKRAGVETEGKHCVVIGRSNIVGKPMAVLMARKGYPGNCTVTLAHSRTKNLAEYTRQADIVVAALGIPRFLKADMVKEGAVVVDVGITRVEDSSKKSGFRLEGDVDFENVAPKCSFITPVPGGVGPMTIASLLQNTLRAVEMRESSGSKS